MRSTLFLALLIAAPALAQTERPPFDPKATMQTVAMLLSRAHVSKEPLDDRISERAFQQLIKSLDPLGLYFLQPDVDALAADKDQLDDFMKAGDDKYAMRVQELYQQRVGEAIELGLKWLDQPLDFEKDETMPLEVAPDGYATDEQDLSQRWRKRIKYDLLILDGDGVTGDEAKARLKKRYEHLAERIALRLPEDVDSTFIEAVTSSFDPHTSYMPPRIAENFAIHMRLNYEGIGASLLDEDGRIVITQVMPGSAALASGQLQARDVIQGVGQGEDGEIKSVVGMEIDDVVDMIRGPRGTTVRLEVTTGKNPPRIVVLQRRKTELVSSLATSKVLTQDGKKVGWIDLPSFYADPKGEHSASRDVQKFLDEFNQQGVDSVVLDLRLNGGGLLNEAVALTGLFIDTGNVVQVRGPDGEVTQLDDDEPGAVWTGPLVVLISRFSASASEIVAGAIEDQGRGLVVGDTSTHGKGTVQTVMDLSRRSVRRGDKPTGALKLTVQQFFRPGGDSTQLHGVKSDIVLPSWTEGLAEGEAALPYALPFSHIAPVVEQHSLLRQKALIDRLRKESAARVAASPDFAKVVAENAHRAGWLEHKVVPLQREKFAEWRGKKLEKQVDADGSRKADDPWYTGEVSRIAVDYAGMVAQMKGLVRKN